MYFDGVPEIVVWTSDIKVHVLPNLAATVHGNELSSLNLDALRIKEHGFKLFLKDGHRVRHFANESLPIEVNLEVEFHVISFHLINICVSTRINRVADGCDD